MYVLDTFNEDIAESLAEHDRELEDNIVNKVVEMLSEVGLDDKTVDMLKERVTKRCKRCGCITFSNSDVCNECFQE